jgi:hypothetical protein
MDRITERDVDDRPFDHDDELATAEEWWEHHRAEACCGSPREAASRLCACGGSAAVPSGISRLLIGEEDTP